METNETKKARRGGEGKKVKQQVELKKIFTENLKKTFSHEDLFCFKINVCETCNVNDADNVIGKQGKVCNLFYLTFSVFASESCKTGYRLINFPSTLLS